MFWLFLNTASHLFPVNCSPVIFKLTFGN